MRRESAAPRPEPLAQESKSRRVKLGPLRSLWPFVKRYRAQVLAAFLALLGAATATLAVPMAVRQMIDHGFSAGDPEFIDNYFLGLVAVVAALAVMSAARYYFVTWLGERVVSDLRIAVFERLLSLDVAFFDASKTGELISRLTADATQIKAAVGASASIALRNLVLFLGAVTMMVITSPRLSSLVLVAIPFIVIPIVVFGRKVRAKSRHAQDTLADASAFASEAVTEMRAVRSFTAEKMTGGRFADAVNRAFAAARSSTLARAILTAFAIFIVFASVVSVLWIGAQDVLSGRLSAGELGQFVLYSVFAAGALGELSQVWGEIAQASGAAERLSELMAEQPSITPPAKPRALPARPQGAVALEEVSFGYGEGCGVLHEIGLKVAPGETVALVGPSGAGKSTLFHLLMRFYDPSAGRITFDGIDLRDLDPCDLRRQVALVPQDTTIFAASVRDNIRFGRPGASDAEVEAAAEAANATAFIAEMKNGFETLIGERGVTLSGGQRQRIAIARAVLKDAPLLLLDEATSALDAQSETLVQAALERLMEGRTTLVIAHRLATVLTADRIVVLEAGRVVEEGRHEDLAASGGLYAKLARLQFETGAAALEGLNG